MYGFIYRVHCGKKDLYGITYSRFFDVTMRIQEDGTSRVYSVLEHMTGKDECCMPWKPQKIDKEYAFAVEMVAAYLHDKKIKTNPA
jgi:hypothetical protein